jgi:hypothetical protein
MQRQSRPVSMVARLWLALLLCPLFCVDCLSFVDGRSIGAVWARFAEAGSTSNPFCYYDIAACAILF